MKLKILFASALCFLFASAAVAQDLSAVCSLQSNTGSEAVVRATASAHKGKVAQDEAVEGAFRALMHQGIEGLNGGQPMFGADAADYEYRFFANQRFLTFLTGNPVKVAENKFGGERRVTFDVPININALLNDMLAKNVPVSHAWAPPKTESPKSAINPVVVVVPVVKGGGSFVEMKALMESDPAVKHAVNKLLSVFAANGFKTRDFTTALDNSLTDDLLRQDAQTDVRTMVVQNLPGDIVVHVDVDGVTDEASKTSSVTLALKAVERQTEGVLAAGNFASGKYHVTDRTRLVDDALGKITGNFFSQLNNAYAEMARNGRQMNLEFQLGQGVDWDFASEAPATGDEFQEKLEDWIHDNAFQGQYNMGLFTDKFIKASVNVPLWDKEKNRAYRLSNFTSALKRFLKSQLGDEYKPEITSMGQRVLITIR